MSKKKNTNKKTLNKPLIAIILAVFILLFDFFVFKITETGTFTVYNYETNQEIKTYKHFLFAKQVMEKEDADTICIKNESDKIVALKYGVVNLRTKNETEEISYETEDGRKGTLDVTRTSDAVYIKTSNSGKKVELMISGEKIWVNVTDVEIYTIESSPIVSYYQKTDSSITHYISQNIKEDEQYSYCIGFVPEFMQDDTKYYSYDGNYFYTDYKTMIKDVINETNKNAVNETAYYNFYQYVPHRTYSNISMDAMNRYLSDFYGITDVASYVPCDGNQSVLFNLGDHIINTQNTYGVNASMIFSLAFTESSLGQSEVAIRNHNLFSHEVYVEAVDREDSYTTFDDCLEQHANYFLQQEYCNPENENYYGSWFGNFKSGMNATYSSNPYWGEQVATIYYYLDWLNGYSDYNSIQTKTFKADEEIIVYGNEAGKNKLYSYSPGEIVSVVVKNTDTYETDKYYAIASEVPIENKKKKLDATYSSECTGYIVFK